MACVPDRDGAVREVAQVYELIKIHQPLLFLHCCGEQQQPSTTVNQLAQSLLGEALRALNVALSIMKQQQPAPAPPVTPTSIKAEPQLSSPSPASAADSEAITSTARRGKRRRTLMEGKDSRISLTTVPYEDGFEWRKYGEKKINGTKFTRSYFRCTYKDDKGCLATKQIQQKDNSDPPMFQVTYNNEHTCNCTTTTATKENSSSNSNNLPLPGYYCNSMEGLINPPHGGHAMIKKEPPVQLPPLVEVSSVPLDGDQMPSQKQFPISNDQQFYGTVSEYHVSIPWTTSPTDSLCISGVSCDGNSQGTEQIVMEPTAGDEPLHDLELFLLYDSFKYY